MQLLERIVAAKREAVARRKRARPLDQLKRGLVAASRSLRQAVADSPCGYILECKHASPSAGVLRRDYDPVRIARQYADVATGISVLADEPFFQGSLEHVRAVSQAVDCPVLCKDFVVEPYQVYEARSFGADAILLMLSVLSPDQLRTCLQAAHELGMDALVEAHDEAELGQALECGARLIGVNNRNLKTLDVSLEVTERLAPRVPADVILIGESGIHSRADIRRIRPLVDGFLIGSSLMRRDDLDQACRELAYGRVKICGLTREHDAQAAWNNGACYGGMIFAPQSPRAITLERARSLRVAAPLRWVGVFVDASPGEVQRAVETLQLSAVQLHGDESPDQVRALRERLPESCEVWKGHRVRETIPQRLQTGADRLLVDAYDPKQHGGTGKRFDWTLVARDPGRGELVLAGGLCPENIAEADALGVWALDVNSGVEESPGIKSGDKLAELFTTLRRGPNPRGGGHSR